MPLTTITLSGLPPERLAAASSLSNFTRTLAGSIGTSITTTMWTNRESMHHAQLTESVTPYNPNAQEMYNQLQGLGMSQQQASGWIAQQITNQGLIISANEIFWMSAGVFGLAGPCVVCQTAVWCWRRWWWCALSAVQSGRKKLSPKGSSDPFFIPHSQVVVLSS
jgi:fatty-acid desaturase